MEHGQGTITDEKGNSFPVEVWFKIGPIDAGGLYTWGGRGNVTEGRIPSDMLGFHLAIEDGREGGIVIEKWNTEFQFTGAGEFKVPD